MVAIEPIAMTPPDARRSNPSPATPRAIDRAR
jgi:hypothetical protein